jgi:hypothetical protein
VSLEEHEQLPAVDLVAVTVVAHLTDRTGAGRIASRRSKGRHALGVDSQAQPDRGIHPLAHKVLPKFQPEANHNLVPFAASSWKLAAPAGYFKQGDAKTIRTWRERGAGLELVQEALPLGAGHKYISWHYDG